MSSTASAGVPRTVVYQSYRTRDVPAWIATCMHTVRTWAASRGFDYRFIDDRLFDCVPAWYRQKAGTQICPLTDLARLTLARQFLAEGYQRTVWVDADIVVFAPAALGVEVGGEFAFCHEVWLDVQPDGQTVFTRRVNNAITVFESGNRHLDFFIDACERIARPVPALDKLDVGTRFLTHLRVAMPFPLLLNVGTFSPALMHDIAGGTARYLRAYAAQLLMPLACANLCASLTGWSFDGKPSDERCYEAVVDTCLRTAGDVVNRLVTPQAE
jgi:hypothetical protein